MYKVGQSLNVGSEASVRRTQIDMTGSRRIAIGHKGQRGSDPNYPDDKDHIAFITKIEPNPYPRTDYSGDELKFVVTRRCSCGLEWSFGAEEADISE